MSTSTPLRGHLRARGFTLIEVLVALIVIAIGTLGIAKMQALALANTGASRTRALAAIEASSLAAAMHTNRAYWASYVSAPGTITVVTSTGSVSSTSGPLQTALTSAMGSQCPTSTLFKANVSCLCTNGNSAPCATTYINMAANDLYDWGTSLGSLLPSANATVTCNNADNPIDCTIVISWTENAVSLTTQESAAAAANASGGTPAAFQKVQYTLYVVP